RPPHRAVRLVLDRVELAVPYPGQECRPLVRGKHQRRAAAVLGVPHRHVPARSETHFDAAEARGREGALVPTLPRIPGSHDPTPPFEYRVRRRGPPTVQGGSGN